MGFCRILDTLVVFRLKRFYDFFRRNHLMYVVCFTKQWNQSYSRDNYGVKLTVIFYKIDSNLYEKISFCHFYRKVSTVTPIEMKQETIWSRPEGGSSRDKKCMVWDWSNSPDGELDKTDSIRCWVSWIGRSSSPSGKLDTRHRASWISHVQLVRWQVESTNPTSHWVSWM